MAELQLDEIERRAKDPKERMIFGAYLIIQAWQELHQTDESVARKYMAACLNKICDANDVAKKEKKIMPDYSLCQHTECPHRNNCYRHKSQHPKLSEWESWLSFGETHDPEVCNFFIPAPSVGEGKRYVGLALNGPLRGMMIAANLPDYVGKTRYLKLSKTLEQAIDERSEPSKPDNFHYRWDADLAQWRLIDAAQ